MGYPSTILLAIAVTVLVLSGHGRSCRASPVAAAGAAILEVQTRSHRLDPSSATFLAAFNDVLVAAQQSGSYARSLQTSDNGTDGSGGGYADPVVVCDSLNEQLKQTMNCTCERFGPRGVDVKCTVLVDQCNSDSTYCVRSSFQYFGDEKGKPMSLTSCTNLTTPGLTEPVDSCVQVLPESSGNFSTITQCYATLNEGTCACSVCDRSATATAAAVPASGSSSTPGSASSGPTAGVSIDCCRLMDGAMATCLPVSPTGPVAIQFDPVSIGSQQQKQCKASSAAIASASVWTLGSASVLWSAWSLL
jgi:hypothetical protein